MKEKYCEICEQITEHEVIAGGGHWCTVCGAIT